MLPPLCSLQPPPPPALCSTPKTALMVQSFARAWHKHPEPTNSNPNSSHLRNLSRTQIQTHQCQTEQVNISQKELVLYPQVDSMVSDLAGHILHSYPCPHVLSTVS